MTTTLLPPNSAAPTGLPQRMLPIAADLLPPEIVAGRRGRVVRRRVLTALGALVIGVGAWYGTAVVQTSVAERSLGNAEQQAVDLQRQQGAFTELIGAQNESRTINTQLSALMARDAQWSELLAAIRSAAPKGLLVSSVSGALTEKAATNKEGGTQRLPDTTGRELVGEVTISGSGPSKAAVAAFVDALAKVEGLGNPYLSDVHSEEKQTSFTMRLDLTDAALGGRFAATGTGTGGK